jgi:hypothetical protein
MRRIPGFKDPGCRIPGSSMLEVTTGTAVQWRSDFEQRRSNRDLMPIQFGGMIRK